MKPTPRWLVVLLILIVAGVMGRVVANDFTTWDDPHTLASNPMFNPPTLAELAHVWDPTRPKASLWVPVTYSAWWGLAEMAYLDAPDANGVRLNPAVFHAASLAGHLLAAVLVFALARRVLPKGPDGTPRDGWAFVAALTFGLHPVQVETVAWTSGLKDVLWGMFALASVYCYVRHVTADAPDRRAGWGKYAGGPVMALGALGLIGAVTAWAVTWERSWVVVAVWSGIAGYLGAAAFRSTGRWWLAGSLLLLLGVWSKPTAMVVPALAVVVHWLMLGAGHRVVARAVWPWFALVPLVMFWTKYAQPAGGVPNLDLPLRPLVALDSMAFYLAKFAWPAHLTFDYGRTPPSILASGVIWWTWLLPVTVAALVLWRARVGDRSTWTFVGAALAWAVVAASPVLGLKTFLFMYFSTVADHYLYASMAGLGMALAAVGARVADSGPGRRRLAVTVAVVALIAWSVKSVVQLGHWKDSETLYDTTLKLNARSFASHTNLAAAVIIDPLRRSRSQDLEWAVGHTERAVEINPDWSRAWDLRGVLLLELWRQRMELAARARDVGALELATQRLQEAGALRARSVESVAKAVDASARLPPGTRDNMAATFVGFGTYLRGQGRIAEALELFHRARADMDLFNDRDPARRDELARLIAETEAALAAAATRPS